MQELESGLRQLGRDKSYPRLIVPPASIELNLKLSLEKSERRVLHLRSGSRGMEE
jgi:hypothetical protein